MTTSPCSLPGLALVLCVLLPAGIACSQRRQQPAAKKAPEKVPRKVPKREQPAPPVVQAAPRPDSTIAPKPAPPRRQVELLCRKAWGARRVRPGLIKHTVKRLTVHHSGVAITGNRRSPRRMRIAQIYHQTGKRSWPDIAYHHVIDLAGNVYEGRATWARGDTGTTYDTTSHYLVCLLGNYDKQRPNPKQLNTLVNLLAWASQRFKVSPKTITGHRDHAATSCPGKNLYGLVKDKTLQRRVTAAAAAGPWKLVTVCGAEASKRIEAIKKGD